MSRRRCVLAALLVSGLGCGSPAGADNNGRARDRPLAAAVEASLGVRDVRATSLVVHSLSGAELKLRGPVRQTPDGASLRARSRVTDSFEGQVAKREVVKLIVADGKVFVRGKGRWRRAEDTSPHFSYDEALALVGRLRHVEQLGAWRYSGDLRFAGQTRFLEPLRLLDESGRHTVRAKVALDARDRVRRFELSAGGLEEGVRASISVRAFNEGLSVEAPIP